MDSASSLGIILDKSLNMQKHISSLTKGANYQLSILRKLKPYLPARDLKVAVQALVISKLNYGIAMLYGLPRVKTAPLEVALNSAARLITEYSKEFGPNERKVELPSKTVKDDLRSKWGLKPTEGHRKCGNCVTCNTTIEGSEFVHGRTTHKHHEFTNCKSRNVVYGIVCPCQKLYIGKTTQQINARITQHRSRLKKKVQNAPMVEHFIEKGHGDTEFKWTVLELVKPTHTQMNVDRILLRKEAYLILKFRSVETGLNSMTELTRMS